MDQERKKQIVAIAKDIVEKDDELLKRLAEGQRITDEINSDPEEVERLRKAREQARTGQTTPLRDAMPDDTVGA